MTADASGTEPGGEAEEDHSRASDRNDKRDASASDLPTEPVSDAASAGASAMPDFARHLHPVAERVRGASEKLAATFNERVVPSTSRSLDDAKHGWRTRVAPSIESGGAAVASFFGAVTDAARQTNDKLKRSNSREAFKSFGEMGDGLSRRAATAMDTIKEGTRELRFGVADLMTRDPLTAAAAAVDASPPAERGAESASTLRDRERANATNATNAANAAKAPSFGEGEKSKRAVSSETDDRDGALLGVALEARAASDARVAPTPYVVMATCQWLGASRAFLETPDALSISIDERDERVGGRRGGANEKKSARESASDSVSTSSDTNDEASRLLESFRTNPTHLIGPDVAPRFVLAALWRYLESLPEPPVAFSLYAALAREFSADAPEREKSDAAEALAGLLPPARRAALECVLGLAARVVAAQSRRGDDASEAAAARRAASAVAPRVAWPRAGRLSPETTRRAFDPSTVLDPSSPSDRAAREARAVAGCVARLIRRRVADVATEGEKRAAT